MGEFRAVYMRCTQEQFERMRPKLEELNVLADSMFNLSPSNVYPLLINDYNRGRISVGSHMIAGDRTQVFTEDEFLEACGYVEQETLQEKEQRLLKELEEVRSQLPKVGDICIINTGVVKTIQAVTNEDIKYFAEVEPLPKELQEQLKPYFNV